jgi:hypothetical protein
VSLGLEDSCIIYIYRVIYTLAARICRSSIYEFMKYMTYYYMGQRTASSDILNILVIFWRKGKPPPPPGAQEKLATLQDTR